MSVKTLKGVYRIQSFLYDPIADKIFEGPSWPYRQGDAALGRLRKQIQFILDWRMHVSGTLRRHHGAVSSKLEFRFKYLS